MARILRDTSDVDFACLFRKVGFDTGFRRGRWMRENRGMRVEVECYSGRVADERPVRFRLEERLYFVEEVIDQWYGPEHLFFKVRADDGNIYILRRETSVPDGEWELVSFRSEHG